MQWVKLVVEARFRIIDEQDISAAGWPLEWISLSILRLDGQFLAEKHSVVNLMNLTAV